MGTEISKIQNLDKLLKKNFGSFRCLNEEDEELELTRQHKRRRVMAAKAGQSAFYDYGTVKWLERATGKPLMIHVGKDEKKRLKEIFNTIDEDGSGAIDGGEIKEMMRELNLPKITKDNVSKAFVRFHNGDGEMGFEEFVMMMTWEHCAKETRFREEIDPFQLKMAFQEVAVALRRKRLEEGMLNEKMTTFDRYRNLESLVETSFVEKNAQVSEATQLRVQEVARRRRQEAARGRAALLRLRRKGEEQRRRGSRRRSGSGGGGGEGPGGKWGRRRAREGSGESSSSLASLRSSLASSLASARRSQADLRALVGLDSVGSSSTYSTPRRPPLRAAGGERSSLPSSPRQQGFLTPLSTTAYPVHESKSNPNLPVLVPITAASGGGGAQLRPSTRGALLSEEDGRGTERGGCRQRLLPLKSAPQGPPLQEGQGLVVPPGNNQVKEDQCSNGRVCGGDEGSGGRVRVDHHGMAVVAEDDDESSFVSTYGSFEGLLEAALGSRREETRRRDKEKLKWIRASLDRL